MIVRHGTMRERRAAPTAEYAAAIGLAAPGSVAADVGADERYASNMTVYTAAVGTFARGAVAADGRTGEQHITVREHTQIAV